jgi:bifunctional enzyme CysN/CysC
VIPISALHGDNIVTRSANTPWYDGPSLLHHLEHVHIASDRNLVDVRFPVQFVIRPQSTSVTDYRGYAGQVASGVLKPGDEVMVLPSGFTTRIAGIDTAEGPVDEAYPPMSVTIRLEDELDVSRGDLICRPHNQPAVSQDIEAMLCWMDETRPMTVGGKYAIKHTTRAARAVVRQLHYRLDVNTLHRDEAADGLRLNEIGRVRLRTTVPLLADVYRRNRTTGGFIVIDETTNRTVGAGMIVEAS